MNTLFPATGIYPDGFEYSPGFLTLQEEQQLLKEVQALELAPFIFQGFEAKRKVKSFGFDYSFDNRRLTKGEPIPQGFSFLVNKVAKHLRIKPEEFAELLVIEYPVGAVMNWHRDAPPFNLIAGVSLASDSVFKLRPQAREKQGRGSIINVPLERRSLYVMRGPVRSDWQHSVAPAKHVRYSITLRTLV